MSNIITARFGPAGNGDSFAEMGYKKTEQTVDYLVKMGLNAFEYQCGRGVRVNENTISLWNLRKSTPSQIWKPISIKAVSIHTLD